MRGLVWRCRFGSVIVFGEPVDAANRFVLEPDTVLVEIVATIADDFSGGEDEVGEPDEAEDCDEKYDRPKRGAGEGFLDLHCLLAGDF